MTTALSGTGLRDRSARFIRAANIDFSPAYIQDPSDAENPVNGLIRTHVGYFRLFRDTRADKTVLLHSFSREMLTGMRDGQGSIVLPPAKGNDYDVYVVSARDGASGKHFRADMLAHIQTLERHFKGDVNLHAEEVFEGDGAERKLKAVRFANKATGFMLYNDGRRWRLRTYFNLRAGWDKADRFAEVETTPPGFFRRFFALSREEGRFNTAEQGLTHLRRLWLIAGMRRFKGRVSPVDVHNLRGFLAFKIRAATAWLDIVENKRYREWGIAIAAGCVTGVFGLTALDFSSVGALLSAGGALLAGSVANKALENYYMKRSFEKIEKSERAEHEALKPLFARSYAQEYIAKTQDNEDRITRKIDPAITEHLAAFTHKDADMNYDNGEFSPPDNPMKDIERLCTAPFHYHSALFDIPAAREENGKIVDGVQVGLYPNGLVSLVHVDLNTRATRTYFTYRKEFDLLTEGKKPELDAGLVRLPGGALPVHKITHRGGRDFRYVAMNEQQFMADLMFKAGPQVRDYYAFGHKISELFNVANVDQIKPAATETEPVQQGRTSGRKTLQAQPV